MQSSTRSGFVSARRWQSSHKREADFAQRFLQQRHVLRAAILIAHRIDQQLKAFETGPAKQIDHHLDHFGVHRWRFRTDGLRANLVKLAITALLRPLAPEHRADVVKLLQSRLLIQAVLDVSAHHRRGGFRTQRERTAVAIVERVHLFADDVGLLAHAARKQSRLFENRRADLLIVVDAKNLARNRFHLIPDGAGRGKDIASAFDCFNHR